MLQLGLSPEKFFGPVIVRRGQRNPEQWFRQITSICVTLAPADFGGCRDEGAGVRQYHGGLGILRKVRRLAAYCSQHLANFVQRLGPAVVKALRFDAALVTKIG